MNQATASLRELHDDRRGAVMLIGLGMSCFLIGALWFMIGIGDAVVFRDTMQEATDHGAYTSAVLHAKGMNFISACNLLMLVAITIHIILGIVHDILLAVCIVFGVETFGAACVPWTDFRPWYTGYAKGMKIFCDIVHYLEVGAAYGYPFLAAYKGYRVGADYGDFSGPTKRSLKVIPISTSMIPGVLITSQINDAIQSISPEKKDKQGNGVGKNTKLYTSTDKKLGLPVSPSSYSVICQKLGQDAFDAIFNLAFGKAGPMAKWAGSVLSMVKNAIGRALQFRYCNALGGGDQNKVPGEADGAGLGNIAGQIDKGNQAIKDGLDKRSQDKDKSKDPINLKPVETGGTGGGGFGVGPIQIGSKGGNIDPGFDKWWGKDGPLLPWGGGSNGSPWYQIWAINWKPDYKDSSEHRVSIAQRKLGLEATAPASHIYFSEAEFYFDCTEDWGGDDCNGGSGENNAGFSVRWRARLRHVTMPEIGTMFSSFLGSFLGSIKGWTKLKGKGAQEIANVFGDIKDGPASNAGISYAVNQLFGQAEGWFKSHTIDKLGGAIDKGLNNTVGKGLGFDDIYH